MIFAHLNELIFVQKKELGELFGFEGRNKFQIFDAHKNAISYAAEENRGLWGFLLRQVLGHWRSFKLHFYDMNRQEVLVAHHPFRFFFQRLEVYSPSGEHHGSLQRRFAVFAKKFDVESKSGEVLYTVSSPLWHLWTFRFVDKRGQQVAIVEKKWGGILKEFFLDADSFRLSISATAQITDSARLTLVAAALFIDLQFFEKKARS